MHEERLCQSCFKKEEERERVVMLLLVVVTTIFSRVKSKTRSSEAAFDKWLLGKHFFHFKMVPTSFFPYSANIT